MAIRFAPQIPCKPGMFALRCGDHTKPMREDPYPASAEWLKANSMKKEGNQAMKTTRTRLLSLLLALVMVFTMLPVTALAAGTTGVLDPVTTLYKNIDYPLWDMSTKASAEDAGWTHHASHVTWPSKGKIHLQAASPNLISPSMNGNYKVTFDVTFDSEAGKTGTSYDGSSSARGLFIHPLFGSSNNGSNKFRIRLHPDHGTAIYNDTGSTSGATNYMTSDIGNAPTTYTRGATYSFVIEKVDDTLSVSITDGTLNWFFEYADALIGAKNDTTPFQFQFQSYLAEPASSTTGVTVSNLTFTKKADITVCPVELSDRGTVTLTDPVFGGDAFADDALPALSTDVTYTRHASNIFYVSGSNKVQATLAVPGEFTSQNLLHEDVTVQDDGGFKVWVNAATDVYNFQIPLTVYPQIVAETSDTVWHASYSNNIDDKFYGVEGTNATLWIAPHTPQLSSGLRYGTLKGNVLLHWTAARDVANGETAIINGATVNSTDTRNAWFTVGAEADADGTALLQIINDANVRLPLLRALGGTVEINRGADVTIWHELQVNGTEDHPGKVIVSGEDTTLTVQHSIDRDLGQNSGYGALYVQDGAKFVFNQTNNRFWVGPNGSIHIDGKSCMVVSALRVNSGGKIYLNGDALVAGADPVPVIMETAGDIENSFNAGETATGAPGPNAASSSYEIVGEYKDFVTYEVKENVEIDGVTYCHVVYLSKAACADGDHSFTELQETLKEATCVEDGLAIMKCATCNATEEQIIPATGAHNYGEVTYSGDGKTAYTATRTCVEGDDTQTTEANIDIQTTPASCTENGKTVYTATFDVDWAEGKVTEETIPATGEHNYEDVVTPPSFDKQGYTTHTCSVCGDTYVDSYVDALIAVAEANGEKYTTLAAAVAAGGEVTLLADVTVDAAMTTAANTTIVLNGKVLTVTSPITVAAGHTLKVTGNGALKVNAQIIVNGTLDIYDIGYGTNGLVPGQTGSLAIQDGGKVIFMSVWADQTAELLNTYRTTFFSGSDDGAQAVLGEKVYTLTNGVWTIAGAVASIDRTNNGSPITETYASLADAIADAESGETIKLLADVALTESIKITSGSVTVDLNGHKLTGPDDGKANWYAFIVDGGDLTLKDSIGTGELYAKCYGIETKSGSFTMESGKITATQNKTYGSAIVNYGGTVVVKGGELSGYLSSVFTGGYFADASTTILDGALTGPVIIESYADKDFTETVASADNSYEAGEGYKWVKQDDVYVLTAKVYIAEVGGEKYETLAAAVAAAGDDDTVTLLKSTAGAGVVIDKNITIDFGGYTYTFTEGVGASGTPSNGFQILKDNEVTLKNGTLNVAAESADKFYILVQNYANLTVEKMTLDGTNLDKWSATDGDSYTLSNNSGAVQIVDTVIKANNNGELAFAFDSCSKAGYTTPVVTVSGETVIYGDIEVTGGELKLDAADIDGALVFQSGSVTKADAVELDAPADYKWVDGVLTAKSYVAEVDGVKYESLTEAFAAAKKGDTITLLDHVTLTEQIKVMDNDVLSNITVNGNNKTITANLNQDNQSVFYFGDTATSAWATGVTVKDLTIEGTARFGIALMGGTSSTLTNVTITGNYVYGINLYGTHGATMTGCNIVTVFTNAQDEYPLNLVNTKIGHLFANKSDVVEDGAKVFIDSQSSVAELTFWGDATTMIDAASTARIETIHEAAARTNNVFYKSLSAAVEAAAADAVITLLTDVSDLVTVSKPLTILKNGFAAVITAGEGYAVEETDEAYVIAEKTVVAGTFTKSTRSLSLAEIVYINQYVTIEGFDGIDLTKRGGLLSWVGFEVAEEDITVNNANLTNTVGLVKDSSGRYAQQSAVIKANEYGKTVYMCFYVQLDDGTYVYSDVYTDSVVNYCQAAFASAKMSEKHKTAFAAMLYYGAAAQVEFDKATTGLVSEYIPAEYAEPDWNSGLIDGLKAVPVYSFESSDLVSRRSNTLSMVEAIGLNCYFYVDESIEVKSAKLMIWNESATELTLTNATYSDMKEVASNKAGKLSFAQQTDLIMANDLGETLFIGACIEAEDGTMYYCAPFAYSPEYYAEAAWNAASFTAEVKQLAKCMVWYGECVRLIFG